MEIFKLNLSDPLFAALKVRHYEKSMVEIPNWALPPSLRDSYTEIYKLFFDKPFDPEDYTLLVRSKAGKFDTIYVPIISRRDNQLVLRWGNSECLLTRQTLKHINIELFNNKLLVLAGGADLKMELTLRPMADIDAHSFVELWQRNKAAATMCVSEAPDNLTEHIGSFRDLPIGTYGVTRWKPITVSWGDTQILTVRDSEGHELQVWNHGSLRQVFNLGPVVSEDEPGELTIVSKHMASNGKLSIECYFTALSYTSEVINL